MRNLIFSALLFGCATTKPATPPAPKEHVWVKPHQLVQCLQKGVVIAWGLQEVMTENDLAMFNRAVDQCGVLHRETPCLRVFAISGNQQYRAICGADDNAPTTQPQQDPT